MSHKDSSSYIPDKPFAQHLAEDVKLGYVPPTRLVKGPHPVGADGPIPGGTPHVGPKHHSRPTAKSS